MLCCVLCAHSQFLCNLARFDLSDGVYARQISRTFSMLDCSYSTRHYSAVSFCSCKLRWRIDECVSISCFNAQPDIFAVMNCCVEALSVFSSDILTWSANGLYSVQWHIKWREWMQKNMHIISTNFAKRLVWKHEYDVKLWHHKQPTPNTNDHHMPLNEKPPHENFLRTPLRLVSYFPVSTLFMPCFVIH